MLDVFRIFALLLAAAMLAGYLPVRMLARSWPSTCRLALQSVLGAGIMALAVAWVHFFSALGDRLAFAALVPVAAGAAALALDIKRRNVAMLSRPNLLWTGLSLAAAALVLAPFFVLGSATSFGLYSNDAFWWTAADWRVQHYRFGVSESEVTSPMARVAIEFKRYGFNYLSVLIQRLTGLRSWQVVHVNGAFGLFLLIQAGWLLARRLRVWWLMAALIALGAAANHLMYRVFLDAVLAFQFGLAFLVAIVAVYLSPIPRSEGTRRAILLGLLTASLGVFYADLLPAAGVAGIAVSVAMLATGTLSRRHLVIAAGGALVCAAAMLPMLLALPEHLRHVATFVLPGPHYRFDDRLHSWMHLFGAMDLYQYMHRIPDHRVQYIGAAAATALAIRALTAFERAQRAFLTAGAVIVCFFLLWRYLMLNGQEYSAHRVTVFAFPFALVLLLASIRSGKSLLQRTWIAVAFLAFVCNLYPAYRMLAYLRTNYIAVTPVEREIGDAWIPALPPGTKVTIDVEEDLELFYGHYMYAEVLHGTGGDESRINLPRTFYNFVQGTPVENFNLDTTGYVLRRKGRGRLLGPFRTVASSGRYELLEPADTRALALTWFGAGFFPKEGPAGQQWRWLSHHGHLTVVSGRHQTLHIRSNLQLNPLLGGSRLDITLNGREVERLPIVDWKLLAIDLPLNPGANTISFFGSKPGVPIPGEDARPVGIRFWTPDLSLAPLAASTQLPEKAGLRDIASGTVQAP
jgi:hypothetical protein